MPGKNEITMNFIGDNHNPMFGTDPAKLFQLFHGPNHTTRIMGTAQNQQFGLFVNISFEVFKIKSIAAILDDQRVFDHLTV